jgi:adenylylsulfate kinase-like enzyme
LRRCWPNKVLSCWFHRQKYRDTARRLAPHFVEVFVDTPLAECQRRDPKGLYKQAPSTLPGSGTSYEVPEHPDLTVRVGDKGVENVLALLLQNGT